MNTTPIFTRVVIFLAVESFKKISVNGLTCYRCVQNEHWNNNCLTGKNPQNIRKMTCLPAPSGFISYCMVQAIRPKTTAEETLPRKFTRSCGSNHVWDSRRCKYVNATDRIECFCNSNNCNTFDIRETEIWKIAITDHQKLPRKTNNIPTPLEPSTKSKYKLLARSRSYIPRKVEYRHRPNALEAKKLDATYRPDAKYREETTFRPDFIYSIQRPVSITNSPAKKRSKFRVLSLEERAKLEAQAKIDAGYSEPDPGS